MIKKGKIYKLKEERTISAYYAYTFTGLAIVSGIWILYIITVKKYIAVFEGGMVFDIIVNSLVIVLFLFSAFAAAKQFIKIYHLSSQIKALEEKDEESLERLRNL